MGGKGDTSVTAREGWCKALVLRRLTDDPGLAVRKLCLEYSLTGSVLPLQKQIARWCQSDQDFCHEYKGLLTRRGASVLGGRHSKEYSDPVGMADWRMKFCEDLFKTGSRLKAAELSPYKYETLYRFLDSKYPEYNKDFAEMVHLVEMRICAEMEGEFLKALRDAPDARTKAWIARSWLERRDATRWGRQVEMVHSGKVEHEHKVNVLPRAQRLELLLQDQKSYFNDSAQKALPAPQSEIVIEAEALELVEALA